MRAILLYLLLGGFAYCLIGLWLTLESRLAPSLRKPHKSVVALAMDYVAVAATAMFWPFWGDRRMSRKGDIRVLLIAPSLDILGGQSVQATHLMKQVGTVRGIEMRFQAISPQFRATGFPRNVPGLRTILSLLAYLPMVFWKIAFSDVVHIFSAGLTSFTLWTIPAVLIGRLYGKQIILHYHDGQVEEHLTRYRSAMPILMLAHAVATPSNFLADYFTQFGLPVFPILNILDPAQFNFRQRSKLAPVFMTNRILEPLYNVECILRATELIQRKYRGASLVVAHDGPSRAALERLASELGLARTRFVGSVSQAEVAKLYDDADIYLTTPNFDCMPGSILESYASGVPIVATKAGGILYIAKHEETALLVDLNDHQAVAESCFRLLEDPALVERLTTNGYNELRKYAPETSRDQWAALYRGLVPHLREVPLTRTAPEMRAPET